MPRACALIVCLVHWHATTIPCLPINFVIKHTKYFPRTVNMYMPYPGPFCWLLFIFIGVRTHPCRMQARLRTQEWSLRLCSLGIWHRLASVWSVASSTLRWPRNVFSVDHRCRYSVCGLRHILYINCHVCAIYTESCHGVHVHMYMYMYSSPHKNVPTTLEYYVGSRLEVASILYTLLRRTTQRTDSVLLCASTRRSSSVVR